MNLSGTVDLPTPCASGLVPKTLEFLVPGFSTIPWFRVSHEMKDLDLGQVELRVPLQASFHVVVCRREEKDIVER